MRSVYSFQFCPAGGRAFGCAFGLLTGVALYSIVCVANVPWHHFVYGYTYIVCVNRSLLETEVQLCSKRRYR